MSKCFGVRVLMWKRGALTQVEKWFKTGDALGKWLDKIKAEGKLYEVIAFATEQDHTYF